MPRSAGAWPQARQRTVRGMPRRERSPVVWRRFRAHRRMRTDRERVRKGDLEPTEKLAKCFAERPLGFFRQPLSNGFAVHSLPVLQVPDFY